MKKIFLVSILLMGLLCACTNDKSSGSNNSTYNPSLPGPSEPSEPPRPYLHKS